MEEVRSFRKHRQWSGEGKHCYIACDGFMMFAKLKPGFLAYEAAAP